MVRYTTRDVIEKIDAEAEARRTSDKKTSEILEQILAQAKYTNGRVTRLEKHSTGMWIRNHTVKFVLICFAIMGLFVKETRDFIIQVIIKAFIG